MAYRVILKKNMFAVVKRYPYRKKPESLDFEQWQRQEHDTTHPTNKESDFKEHHFKYWNPLV